MAGMDVFEADAFSRMEMTAALNRQDFQPSYLRSLNLFTPRRVRTETIAIEEKDGVLNIIQTSKRGAPLTQAEKKKRRVRDFRTVRIAKEDELRASEISGIRAFGSETELMQVQAEVADRLNGPAGLMRDVELTWENMQLGTVQGILLDADGSEIYNWFSEFGVVQAAEVAFDLANANPASGVVRKLCNRITRQMMKAAKGVWVPGRTYVMAIVGDDFWDDLTAHKEIRETYLNTQQAADLRNDVGAAYETFRYGGITWVNYRGTDDGSTVSIAADEAKFFPVAANGAFQWASSPGESFELINLPGQDVYAMSVPDRDRNMFISLEVYSYPLMVCTRPAMLQRGIAGP